MTDTTSPEPTCVHVTTLAGNVMHCTRPPHPEHPDAHVVRKPGLTLASSQDEIPEPVVFGPSERELAVALWAVRGLYHNPSTGGVECDRCSGEGSYFTDDPSRGDDSGWQARAVEHMATTHPELWEDLS